VHTGYWGCGAFGGNRTLMALLQVLAARMAGLDRLIFHTGGPDGEEPFKHALERVNQLGSGPLSTSDLLDRLVAMRFEWGVGNGT
jgi:hypothetical protein